MAQGVTAGDLARWADQGAVAVGDTAGGVVVVAANGQTQQVMIQNPTDEAGPTVELFFADTAGDYGDGHELPAGSTFSIAGYAGPISAICDTGASVTLKVTVFGVAD